jgi:ADP-heptose:LPS heptosyltransferase
MKKALIVNLIGVGNGLMVVPLLKTLDISFPKVKYYYVGNPFFEIKYFKEKAGLKNLDGSFDITWRSFPRKKWPAIIKFIKKINRITSVVEQETVKIMNDVEEARSVVKQHIGLVRGVASATVIKKIIEKIFNKNKI